MDEDDPKRGEQREHDEKDDEPRPDLSDPCPCLVARLDEGPKDEQKNAPLNRGRTSVLISESNSLLVEAIGFVSQGVRLWDG